MPPIGAHRRVLDDHVVQSIDEHIAQGGGEALTSARGVHPVALIETLEASGLRGRGGGGFPTGTKWRTVAGMGGAEPTTVVVNAAEGEPGTLKDRSILRRNPYRVLEGALIAAQAVAADRVLIGFKSSARRERRRMDEAIAEAQRTGWLEGLDVATFAGSNRYLAGEETGLLEVANGRPPFPRVAPPYREGVELVGPDTTARAGTEMADPEGETGAPATLVNNVETLANVPAIVQQGPEWFRSVGTEQSPGTIVCTVSGRTERAGVDEYALGTPLRQVLDELGGRPLGQHVVAVLSGTANPFLAAADLDAPLSWEGLQAAGGGLGSAGFIVIDDEVDLLAVAHGVSRFLAVESCGQCRPCKQDGLRIAELLDAGRRSELDRTDVLIALADTVTRGARCYLAQQQQNVLLGLLERFPGSVDAHVNRTLGPADEYPIVPLLDIVDGEAVLDLDQLGLHADWQDDSATDPGATPAERLDVRAHTG
jgi:NADH:ubiquinone oxidoreductase subunit F (NADH-binding)